MKLCFAVLQDDGVESTVYGHFGSAPAFMVVNTEDNVISKIVNSDLNHIHGACNPMKALGGADIDAVIVGGIGQGALNGLNARGIKVFKAIATTIKDNLSLFHESKLPELTMDHTCGGHANGCAHH